MHKKYKITVKIKSLFKSRIAFITDFNIIDLMIFEVKHFEDLTAYRLGRFHSATNLTVYFFSYANIYIDSAQSRMQKLFLKIAKNNIPEYCLLTHYHEDHAGNAAMLQNMFSTTIVAHQKSENYLSKAFKMLPYEVIIWGKFQPFKPDLFYEDNIEIGTHKFQIIHTPGHSEDSVCILDKARGWLFSGDLYISPKPRYLRKDENIYEILNSLKTLLQLDFKVMFCSHKGILKDSPKSLIQTKINYLEELIYKTKELQSKGINQKDIRNKLLGKEDTVSFLTSFDFCKLNLIKSILHT